MIDGKRDPVSLGTIDDPRLGPVEFVEFGGPVVVGSGVAGMAAALAAGPSLLLTEGAVGDTGSSRWAQGGLAAAVGRSDDPAAHARDTVSVAGGLAVADVVRSVVGAAPAAVADLIARGARFDTDHGGALRLGREAGHTARRIVHARGDATGAEIVHTIRASVLADPRIGVWDGTRFVDLLSSEPAPGEPARVCGVLVSRGERIVALLAPPVILATGGYGHLFARTTTPAQVIGSGVAAAIRVGAQVADLEFVQFHPTALDTTRTPTRPVDAPTQLPLLTEALRGEGAVLVDETGRRFMTDVSPDAELAARDVVARAIYRHAAAGHEVWLDARSIGEDFDVRFPTVFASARAHGIDPRRELLPVSPAAHYCMGGVVTDQEGRTTVEGLWAAGEVTSTGLHGANRLASNSLLEGLVVGRRAGRAAAASVAPEAPRDPHRIRVPADLDRALVTAGTAAGEESVRSILWRGLGVERSAAGIAAAERGLRALGPAVDLRGRSMRLLAEWMVRAAAARRESRGAHFRSDHPDPDVTQATRRIWSPVPQPLRRLGHGYPDSVAAAPTGGGHDEARSAA